MTATLPRTPDDNRADTPPPKPSRQPSKGWFGQLLLRLHFYAGIFVGPFILVAALSGAAYAAAPSIERVVYADFLTASVTDTTLSLADQVRAANAHIDASYPADTLYSVRPAAEPGATTMVLYNDPEIAPLYRAVAVDPGTGEVRGDLPMYFNLLPIQTWLDQLHANLHLGEPGTLYTELAASWLGVIALAGLALWIIRRKRARAKRDFIRPNNQVTGYRRIFSWHASTGVWLLVGALFLSATGITWSQLAGPHVTELRSALSWETPYVDPALTPGDGDTGGGHNHNATTAPAAPVQTVSANPGTFDAMLSIGREVNINVGAVEILPPAAAGTAWVVQEIQYTFPTEVDSVAINGQTMQVIDQVNFADYPLGAKLARWGIDTHMGLLWGLANQIVLFITALGIAAMVVFGYLMWWKRRPTKTGALVGKPPARGALRRAPWWGAAAVIAVGIGIGLFLPLLGYTLAAFVVVDLIVGAVQRRRAAGPAR